MPYSIGQGSGALVTATDVVFHGEPDGHVQAYDARNGELLWQWQTGAGADAPAITYEIDGVQYLTIAVGGLATQTASTNGDMVWAFSLQGSPNNRVAQFEPPPPPPTGVTFGFTGLLKGGVPIVKTNAVRMIDYIFTPPRIAVEAGGKAPSPTAAINLTMPQAPTPAAGTPAFSRMARAPPSPSTGRAPTVTPARHTRS